MKIKFIGTGSGKTSLKRHHSSLLISSGNHNLLIDCGDGITAALLKQNISFEEINSIIISHLHADHFAGLPSLLTQMKMSKRKVPLEIFVPDSDLNFVELLLERFFLFRERMGFELKIISYNSDYEILLSENFKLIPRLNSHLDKYKLNHPDKSFSSYSFILSDTESNIFYSGDIGSVKDFDFINKRVEYIITETTHIPPDEIISLAIRFDSAKIILTHFDDETELKIKSKLESMEKRLKSNIILAFDGFEI